MTDPDGEAYKQSIFHPFAAASALARGRALLTKISAPEYRTPTHGSVPLVAAAATHDDDSGATALFLTNRDSDAVELSIDHGSFASFDLLAATTISAGDPRTPRELSLLPLIQVDSNACSTTLVLPPESWTVLSATASD